MNRIWLVIHRIYARVIHTIFRANIPVLVNVENSGRISHKVSSGDGILIATVALERMIEIKPVA